MFKELFNSLSISQSILSFISIAATLVSFFYTKKVQEKHLKNAKRLKHEEILSSDNIEKVGDYLYEDIGNFRISDYTSNREIQSLVDSYLTKLETFLDKDELNVEKQENSISKGLKVDKDMTFIQDSQKLVKDLLSGENWNVLAHLRRTIEFLLKEVAEKHNIKLDSQKGAGSLLRALYSKEIINDSAYRDLGYAISICNKAVHGENIKSEQAEEAIFLANRGMEEIHKSTIHN
ncbi:hypothetical protein [Priestia megaterium]|uniref:hypothetical protein n=1 Tax=Priestia megaterium TaxID=1404 RepID=UPI00300BEAEC